MLRLLGVRLGRRVFDDGCALPERTLVTIGDDCTLNAGSIIQCHSQEDGAFKSDYITIGSGCTIGVGAWVHYGVTMGDGAVLAPDSFLMKGEQVPQHAYWGGNPAEEMQGSAADLIRSQATPSSSPEEQWSWDLDARCARWQLLPEERQAGTAARAPRLRSVDRHSRPRRRMPPTHRLRFGGGAHSSGGFSRFRQALPNRSNPRYVPRWSRHLPAAAALGGRQLAGLPVAHDDRPVGPVHTYVQLASRVDTSFARWTPTPA